MREEGRRRGGREGIRPSERDKRGRQGRQGGEKYGGRKELIIKRGKEE